VAGADGGHEAAAAQAEQIILRHQPRHPLVVHRPALVAQLARHPPVAVVAPVPQHDLLHPRPQLHLLGARFALLPVTIKPGSADLTETAHGLDAKVCLRPHHSDLRVDAVSPEPIGGRR
jgi:hypothetical protein